MRWPSPFCRTQAPQEGTRARFLGPLSLSLVTELLWEALLKVLKSPRGLERGCGSLMHDCRTSQQRFPQAEGLWAASPSVRWEHPWGNKSRPQRKEQFCSSDAGSPKRISELSGRAQVARAQARPGLQPSKHAAARRLPARDSLSHLPSGTTWHKPPSRGTCPPAPARMSMALVSSSLAPAEPPRCFPCRAGGQPGPRGHSSAEHPTMPHVIHCTGTSSFLPLQFPSLCFQLGL